MTNKTYSQEKNFTDPTPEKFILKVKIRKQISSILVVSKNKVNKGKNVRMAHSLLSAYILLYENRHT